MSCVRVVVKREKKLLTPDRVAELTSEKRRAGKEWNQTKCMPTFGLIGGGMAERSDIALVCPLSPSKQVKPLVKRSMRLRSLCAMII